MDVPERAGILTLAFEAARRLGRALDTASSCGSSDANIFNDRGIQCVDLSTGMRAIHTVHEWIDLRDMVATAELTVATLATSARAGREA
jgi:tripeptide aminopeptidase